MGEITVSLTAESVAPRSLKGRIAIVVDVLRASTSIACAIQAGVAGVIPCLTIEDARRVAEQSARGGDRILLGGERGGVRIEGFDFGNSPTEYSRAELRNATIAFTTTNGTKALNNCLEAERIVIGSFVNAAAVLEAARVSELPVHVCCAGTDGAVSSEDVLLAGLLVERCGASADGHAADDAARIASHHWRMAMAVDHSSDAIRNAELEAAIRISRGGRNLIRLGYDADIRAAAALDSLDVVPEYDRASARIIRGTPGSP